MPIESPTWEPRIGHTCTVVGDKKLYIMFGQTAEGMLFDGSHILAYDCGSAFLRLRLHTPLLPHAHLSCTTWTETDVFHQLICSGDVPCERVSHSCTMVGQDKLVVFGGLTRPTGSQDWTFLDDVHVLDLS